MFVFFGKVHFTVVIMPKKNLGLTGTNFIGIIFGKMVDFFAESCLSTVHSTESDKGQRKMW
jgi:hypothetical protein